MKFYLRNTIKNSVSVHYYLNLSQTEKVRGSTNVKVNPTWNAVDKDGNILKPLDLSFPNAPKKEKTTAQRKRRSLEDFDNEVTQELEHLREQNVNNVLEEIKLFIDVKLGKISLDEDDKVLTLFEFIDYQIEHKAEKVSLRTIQDYERLKSLLEDYQRRYKTRVSYNSINKVFKKRFENYLQNVQNFKKNTIWKHFKNLKHFMNESFNEGYHSNTKYKLKSFQVPKETTHAIFLKEEELDLLFKLKLDDRRLEAVRDYFLLMSYTGMRVGDMMRQRRDSIIEYNGVKMISYHVKKTDTNRAFDITPKMQIILNRWNGVFPNDILKKKITDNFINLEIKKMSKDILPEKYKEIGCHTARRSFCTNGVLKGTSISDLMRQSGHQSFKTFIGYVKADDKEITAALSNYRDGIDKV